MLEVAHKGEDVVGPTNGTELPKALFKWQVRARRET
jgi:hypothetical protein